MSSCPHGDYGQPLCAIFTHPDKPNESVCGTCQRRFVRRDFSLAFGAWMALIAATVLLLASGRSRSELERTGIGVNDLPNSSDISQVLPVRRLSLYEQMRLEDNLLPERVTDWPMEKQLQLLNDEQSLSSLIG